MQKFIFLGIGLVLNLLEDAVGRLELARARVYTVHMYVLKGFILVVSVNMAVRLNWHFQL